MLTIEKILTGVALVFASITLVAHIAVFNRMNESRDIYDLDFAALGLGFALLVVVIYNRLYKI